MNNNIITDEWMCVFIKKVLSGDCFIWHFTFWKHESVSIPSGRSCLCLSWESKRRWLLLSTVLWQLEEPGGTRDIDKWPWESTCWHFFFLQEQRKVSCKLKNCDKRICLSVRYTLAHLFCLFLCRPLKWTTRVQLIRGWKKSARSCSLTKCGML